MEYQTPEQFEAIYNSIVNGQDTQAAEMCVEYRFFHRDLREAYERIREGYYDSYEIKDAWKLGKIAELAQSIRDEKEMESVKG